MFDPYHKWLGIPPRDQPPHHYRLLSLDPFEADAEVIAAAVTRQMAYVRQMASGEHKALSQKLLGELTAARACLLNLKTKAEYDKQLQAALAEKEDAPEQAGLLVVAAKIDANSTPPSGRKLRRKTHQFSPWSRVAGTLIAGGLGLLAAYGLSCWVSSRAAHTKTEDVSAVTPPKSPDDSAAKRPRATGKSSVATARPKKTAASPLTPLAASPAIPAAHSPVPTPDRSESPSTPQPEPAATSVAELPAETLEAAELRLKNRLASATSAAEFEALAANAFEVLDRGDTASRRDVAKRIANCALSAARKSGNAELVKQATLRVVQASSK